MNWTALYLLSILDNLSNGFNSAYLFCIWIAIIVLVYWGIMRLVLIDKMDNCSSNRVDMYKDRQRENDLFLWKWPLRFFITAMAFRLLTSFVPGKRDLVEAYAMIEGSKIITAANGEVLAKEVAGRFDKFMDIIATRWGAPDAAPKAAEVKETPTEDASTK